VEDKMRIQTLYE